jgi:hypothetical protein
MKKIMTLTFISAFALSIAINLWPATVTADENVALESGVSVYPIAERLTKYYIENLVNPPEDNMELLRLYIQAFKNFEKDIMECDKSDYNLNIIENNK